MDILIPLGTGSAFDNLELRFALRSIERYAAGVDRVFVIGDFNPGFLSSRVIYREEEPISGVPGNKEARIGQKVRWAFESTDISDNIAFWNDDFILTRPCSLSAIPYYQRGNLADAALLHPHAAHANALRATADALAEHGKNTLSYELHCPIVYNRTKFLLLNDLWDKSARLAYGLGVKSIYSNYWLPTPGPFLADSKIFAFDEAAKEKINNAWVYSYSDHGFESGLRHHLEQTFPEKSIYEN
jgi:hypothetical protein